jgi:hypothetical protein
MGFIRDQNFAEGVLEGVSDRPKKDRERVDRGGGVEQGGLV